MSGKLDPTNGITLVENFVGGAPVSASNPFPTTSSGSAPVPAKATPSAPATQTITVGGTSQTVFPANGLTNLGIIQNPPTATEPMYVCGSGAANVTGTAGTFTLLPGQSFNCYPSTLAWTVNAATTGHAFTAEAL